MFGPRPVTSPVSVLRKNRPRSGRRRSDRADFFVFLSPYLSKTFFSFRPALFYLRAEHSTALGRAPPPCGTGYLFVSVSPSLVSHIMEVFISCVSVFLSFSPLSPFPLECYVRTFPIAVCAVWSIQRKQKLLEASRGTARVSHRHERLRR